ncbi:MAG TPA: hypothetical protein DCY79_15015 [Planctomycetaceae bacterium]|nr:hypothetical protein [Blastopirellula sp.]HAY81114.1 hypothetical protein [Planctomycetaceae bacterium]
MKRPWQIWMLFVVSVAFAFAALVWLSAKAIESNTRERQAWGEAELARRQAEQQELVSSALWRMDGMLAPLVSQETSRPYFFYQPFYKLATNSKTKGSAPTTESVPSPLLLAIPDYVLLHFQIDEDGTWTSPQRPVGKDVQHALVCGLDETQLSLAKERLGTLSESVAFGDLQASLPDELLQPVDIGEEMMVVNNLIGDVAGNVLPARRGGDPPGVDPESQVSQNADSLEQSSNTNAARQQQLARAPVFQQQIDAQQAEPPQQQQKIGKIKQSIPMLRASNDFVRRNQATQNYAFNQRLQWHANAALLSAENSLARETATQSMWVDDKLLIARRVEAGDRNIIQGCWLDWDRLVETLKLEVDELLPDAELAATLPDSQVKQGQRLATLPVHLVFSEPQLEDVSAGTAQTSRSAIHAALLAAWLCLLLTTCAVAVLLQGVVKLSERRGAFVSAVTHELRTPLTTFRMYAEMLSQNMVPDPNKRAQYLETLQVEADRLSHLVENVLQYARLERGRPGKNRASVQVNEMLDRFSGRLRDRAAQADMELTIRQPEAVDVTLFTDATAVEQILFNLVDNACKYAASAERKQIVVACDVEGKTVRFGVRDYGPGISAREATRLFRPFSKSVDQAANSAPGVGLGLALCKRLANDLGGRLRVASPDDGGSEFVLTLPK